MELSSEFNILVKNKTRTGFHVIECCCLDAYRSNLKLVDMFGMYVKLVNVVTIDGTLRDYKEDLKHVELHSSDSHITCIENHAKAYNVLNKLALQK